MAAGAYADQARIPAGLGGTTTMFPRHGGLTCQMARPSLPR